MVGFGDAASTLQVRTDHPVPERKPGEVLVKVAATSINPAEWIVRQVGADTWCPLYLFTFGGGKVRVPAAAESKRPLPYHVIQDLLTMFPPYSFHHADMCVCVCVCVCVGAGVCVCG